MTVTPAASPAITLQQALEAATARYQAGRPAEAIPLLGQILEKLPEQPAARQLRGFCRLQLGELSGALADLDYALALQPGWSDVEQARASVLRRMGRREDALAIYLDLARRPNPPPGLFNNKGNCLLDLGRNAEALADFEQALAQNPKDEIAAANRATALTRLGRGAEGLDVLIALIQSNPKSAQARRQLVVTLITLGRIEDAEKMAEAGATAHRPWADGWLLVAQHYVTQAAPQPTAERACRAAIAAAPEQMLPRRLFAMALHLWGRFEEAEIQCRAGLGLVPDEAELRALLVQVLAQQAACSAGTIAR